MKMKAEHYSALKALIYATTTVQKYGIVALEAVYITEHEAGALKADDIHKRLRWDLFRCVDPVVRKRIMDDLYEYLNDDHIDTALKQVVNELSAEEGASTPMETL